MKGRLRMSGVVPQEGLLEAGFQPISSASRSAFDRTIVLFERIAL